MYWLCFALIIAILSKPIGGPARSSLTGGRAMEARTSCLPANDISTVVQRLSSPLSDAEFAQVKKVLFGNAKRSPRCRKQVITVLMAAMDRPNLDLSRDPASFDTWNYGASLLGQLKAAEALDLLIAHLNITDGRSPNMNHFPAVGGVIRIGPIAIPKLRENLMQNKDRYIRRTTVFCIAQIGGRSAMRALKEALPLESDRCNSQFIMASIKAFDNNRFPNHITSKDRSEWFSTFYCTSA